jgi:hypothetical protein
MAIVIEIGTAAAAAEVRAERAPGCNHVAPTRTNRFCSSCGALILAHEYRVCPEGHFAQCQPAGGRTVNLWCWECQAFRPCTKATAA